MQCPLTSNDEVYNCSETDCVLLVKQLVNSESLSQPPTVCLPGDFGKRLKAPLEGLPRNLVSDRAKKEFLFLDICHFLSMEIAIYIYIFILAIYIFTIIHDISIISCPWAAHDPKQPSHMWPLAHLRFLKTADVVEKEPWNLHRAAGALRHWVDLCLVLCFIGSFPLALMATTRSTNKNDQ